MRIRLATWKIKTLILKKSSINPKPQYQRTSVWNKAKKKLLIDSILRGYDLPKFYLRATPNDPIFEYEVTDGQQRMRSIWEFVSDLRQESYQLDENIIDGINTKNLRYDQLSSLKDKFDSFELNIAIIEDSSPEEIRSLFARLQMGASLNQVELRHAIASNIGAAIQGIVDSHVFFKDSKISNSRYKHQDYMDHVITLCYYDGITDLRAQNIRDFYLKLKSANRIDYQNIIRDSILILDKMRDINLISKGIFKNKWAFVDTFWMLYKKRNDLNDLNPRKFVNIFIHFENKRLEHQKNPEILIESSQNSQDHDKDLYEYIMAFKYSGNEKSRIQVRSNVFENLFADIF
ncbi:MAG: hypothetical protein CMB80_14470 [Flammeovirgaceae bacterium]|nr:hypothetical protein [Flammeovirgaceae bacterium]MBE62058.1 hypothetical protein [Flammeovirgaceae bacterium]|tara:strand:- start:5047 stop:6087 length:1041 start_codon:yes stop_codon:yes gene_type:complete